MSYMDWMLIWGACLVVGALAGFIFAKLVNK